MINFFTIITLGALTLSVNAQTPSSIPTTELFGKVDKADLEMKSCDFEKDANAEVLFDKGLVYFLGNEMGFERHVRIKIFNEKGNSNANIRIGYWGGERFEYISKVQAETINLNNGNIEFTKIDKKLIYTETVDRYRTAMVFSFPNVKPGSVVEFKYTLVISSIADFPDWFFQTNIPTRYSELKGTVPGDLSYRKLIMINRPFVKKADDFFSMSNIPSFREEPYMSSKKDNLDRVIYQLTAVGGVPFSDTWKKIGDQELNYDDFGGQFKRKLDGEEAILAKAEILKTNDDKIAYIFNEVKNRMKWNDEDLPYTNDGTKEAWAKKTGNSTEINLALFHLLQKAGLSVLPMLVSTKDNGKVNPAFINKYQFNKTVAYIPVDSNKYYVLDATSKYNIYNEVPNALLNRFGFSIDKQIEEYHLVFLQKTTPVRKVALINGEIKPDGKLVGTVQLNTSSYDRMDVLERYKKDGEKKYIEYLINGDNNLRISSIKLENMEIDTLPLTQDMDFNLALAGSDETYIYFNPNLFISQKDNPFLSEYRNTDIDFGHLESYTSSGIFKEPVGYKVDALPKSVSMATPDKGISFKRIVGEQDGVVVVRFFVNYNKSVYFKEEYPYLHEFFKKMNEMINEQIVFRKI